MAKQIYREVSLGSNFSYDFSLEELAEERRKIAEVYSIDEDKIRFEIEVEDNYGSHYTLVNAKFLSNETKGEKMKRLEKNRRSKKETEKRELQLLKELNEKYGKKS